MCLQLNVKRFLVVICECSVLCWVCWGTDRLNKMKAGSVIGCRRDTCEVLVKRKSLNKLLCIMNNPDHTLYHLPDR